MEGLSRVYLLPAPGKGVKDSSQGGEKEGTLGIPFQVLRVTGEHLRMALLAKAASSFLPPSQPNGYSGLQLCLAHSPEVSPEMLRRNFTTAICSESYSNPVGLLASPACCPVTNKVSPRPFYLYLAAKMPEQRENETNMIPVELTVAPAVVPDPRLAASTEEIEESAVNTFIASTSGLSRGAIVFFLLVSAVLVYFIGGALLRYRQGERTCPGLLPHHVFWSVSLPGALRGVGSKVKEFFGGPREGERGSGAAYSAVASGNEYGTDGENS